MPTRTELQGDNDRATTFNVVFTPGTVLRLLPFSLSLLQSPGVHLRLVANGCDPAEIDLMRGAEESNERISHHVLPSADTVEHGHALNHLFEAFPEPHFAFIDSDVIAGADFIGSLLPLAPGVAGVFTATPVWRAEGTPASRRRPRNLMGQHTLSDGTFVGNTFCAIYERGALEPVWRATPMGFVAHHSYMVPRGVKASLVARGWNFRTFDTGFLINLQLLLAGFELEERKVPELHHIGAVSARDFQGLRGTMRRVRAVLRSRSQNRPRALAHGIVTRFHSRGRYRLTRREGRRRRQAVVSYIDEVLDAILAGEPTPPAPRTGSAEVDRRVAELVATLEIQYPRGAASLREAADAPLPGVRAGGA